MDSARKRSTRLNHRLPKLGGWVSSTLLIAGLLGILGGTACGTACQGELPDTIAVQFERELPAVVMTGDEFWVTVTFTSPEDDFHAIALTDLAPAAGWNVSVDVAWTQPPAMMAHTPEPEMAVYIWEGPYDAGVEFSAAYKIRVPVDAEPGAYTFNGSLEYYIEPSPAPSYKDEIAGGMQVTVS